MIMAGCLTIAIATLLLKFLYNYYISQSHTQNTAIISLERQLLEEKLKQQEEETQIFKKMSEFDSLTNLPNRRFFLEDLTSKLECFSPNDYHFALIFIDVDNLKEVNDSYGHKIGDLVLKQFAKRLKSTLRTPDYPARYAGDEFVSLITQFNDKSEIEAICNRILNLALIPYKLSSNTSCSISVSIGVVLHNKNGKGLTSDILNNPQELVSHADKAMYEAKRRGKNRWILYEDIASE